MISILSKLSEANFQSSMTSVVSEIYSTSDPLTLRNLESFKSLLASKKHSTDYTIKETIKDQRVINEYIPIFRCDHSIMLAFWLLYKRGSEKNVNSVWRETYNPRGTKKIEITEDPLILGHLSVTGKKANIAMLMLAGADLDASYVKYIYDSNDPQKKEVLETYTIKEFINQRKKERYGDQFVFREDGALYLSNKQKTQSALKKYAANPKLALAKRVAAYKALAHFYEDLWFGTLDRKSKKNPTRKDDGLNRCFINKKKQLKKDGVILEVFLLLLVFQAYEDAMSALNEYQQQGIETKVYKADLEYRMHEICDQLPQANNEHKLVDFWNLLIPKQMKHLEDRKQSYLSKITSSIYSTFANRKGKEKLKNQLQYQPMELLHSEKEDRTTNRI